MMRSTNDISSPVVPTGLCYRLNVMHSIDFGTFSPCGWNFAGIDDQGLHPLV